MSSSLPHSAPPPTPRLLTDDELRASMTTALTAGWNQRDDLWVFGYGSLIWRPEFEHTEQRAARVQGYHRALCLWSRVNRGTPELPGLVFGLDRGGACKGMAYRIAAADVPTVFEALWKREMPLGAYLPRWLTCHTAQGPIQALVFVMDRRHSGYAGLLPDDRLVATIRQGHGRYGPCVEYVTETARALQDSGITDRSLDRIVRLLEAPATHPAP